MSGHTVAPQLEPIAAASAAGRSPGEFVPVRGNRIVGMRVTIMLDRQDWTPEAIDARLTEVRKTMDEFIAKATRK